MKLCLKNEKALLVMGIIFALSGQTSEAALLGTDLSVKTVFQQTAVSSVNTIGFLTTAHVVEPGVEFSSLAATEVINPTLGLHVVDVAINAGDNFLDINFDNVSPAHFVSAFLNGYVFTFDSIVAAEITGATIDTSVTTLGLVPTDLAFSGNQLIVNVEGLSFNTSTFARINLTSVGGPAPVPVPAAAWLFASGLLGLLTMKGRRIV